MSHRLQRDAHGAVIWPDAPVVSTTARLRTAAQVAAANGVKVVTKVIDRTWSITVTSKGHSRIIEVTAPTKADACERAIDQYRRDAWLPTSTSILVTDCTRKRKP